MSIYTLDIGLVLQTGDAQWRVQRILDHQYVQLENQTTGRIRKERIGKLANDIANGRAVVVRDSESRSRDTRPVDKRNHVTCTATLPLEYQQSLERSHAYVRSMQKRGITRGQRARITEAATTIAALRGEEKPPSASTIMRWLRNYALSNENPTSLLSHNVKRRSPQRLPEKVLRTAKDILTRYYFVRTGCTLRVAHDRIIRALQHQQSGSEISLSTVRRLALEVSPYERDRSRLGMSQARAKWRSSQPGIYATRPLERVEMDHTLLDLVVLDDRLGIPLGRPTITLVVCSYSGYVLGFFVSFEGETIGRVIRSIKIAIQPKDELIADQKLNNPWYAMGLWEALVVDNALSFHSSHLHHVALDLCMDIEYCPVRMPWFKPSVERNLGELTRQLPAPGRPRKPGSGYDIIDPHIDACITFSDLCHGILRWVVDIHPFEVHQRKLARPVDLFLEGLDQCPAPRLIEDSRSLDILAGLSKTVTVDHSGITHLWLRYVSDDLNQLRREIGAKFKVHIKFDPYDLGRIFVRHPRTGGWFVVPARDQQYAAGLTLTQHKLIRKAASTTLTSANCEQVLRASRLALQDHWHSAIKTGRALRRTARDFARFSALNSAETRTKGALQDYTPEQIVTDLPEFDESKPIPSFSVFKGDLS